MQGRCNRGERRFLVLLVIYEAMAGRRAPRPCTRRREGSTERKGRGGKSWRVEWGRTVCVEKRVKGVELYTKAKLYNWQQRMLPGRCVQGRGERACAHSTHLFVSTGACPQGEAQPSTSFVNILQKYGQIDQLQLPVLYRAISQDEKPTAKIQSITDTFLDTQNRAKSAIMMRSLSFMRLISIYVL